MQLLGYLGCAAVFAFIAWQLVAGGGKPEHGRGGGLAGGATMPFW